MLKKTPALRQVCLLATILLLACSDDDENDLIELDGATMDGGSAEAGAADGGHLDANQLDSGALDASKDSGAGCFSPLRPPASFQSGQLGCACVETETSRFGFCLGGHALICAQARWMDVLDGPCFPEANATPGWCAQASGAATTGQSCPSGFHRRQAGFKVDAGPEEQVCCLPIEVSASECTAAGLRVLAAGAQTRLLETRCADGGVLKAFVPGNTPSLCCE